MSQTQRLQFEKNLEDEYVTGEFTWNSKKKDIIKMWADSCSHHIRPVNLICQHIKRKLRDRGISEGSIAYVHESLDDDNYDIYKDPRYDTSEYIDMQRRGNPRPSIFEDYGELAKETLTPEELEQRSPAEQYEIITKEVKLIKSFKTKFSDRINVLENFSQTHKVKIPEFETESSDIPPEHFWGQSEAYYDARGFEQEHAKLSKSWGDVAETLFHFRPTPEVAAYCSKRFKEYKDNDFANFRLANMVLLKAYQNVTNPVSDGKWGELLDGWFKIGWDQKVNCGSHGSGVVNSIDTGEYVIKEYKDGRREVVGLKREFTREQVGDKTSRDLLKLAMVAVSKDQVQRALTHWIKNTNLVEMVGAGEIEQ
jgi:hypothetical protein